MTLIEFICCCCSAVAITICLLFLYFKFEKEYIKDHLENEKKSDDVYKHTEVSGPIKIQETSVVEDTESPLFDYTYGVRALGYLQEEYTSAGSFAQIWAEEYEYLCATAYRHIKYTFDQEEYKWYFENMVKGVKSCDEFVEKWYRPIFVKFLKNAKIMKKHGKKLEAHK